MQKRLIAFIFCVALTGCNSLFLVDEPAEDQLTTFDYLSAQIAARYAYLDEKNINWQATSDSLRGLISPGMPNGEFFEVLSAQLEALNDGHANLIAGFRTSVYLPITTGFPRNYSEEVLTDRYLFRVPENFQRTGPFDHSAFASNGRLIGLITYRSFSSSFSEGQLEYILNRLSNCDGIILDLRDNGGGLSTNVNALLRGFIDEERITLYSQEVTPNCFSELIAETSGEPYPFAYTGRVAVLINRTCYSATSFFATSCLAYDHIRLIGDTTSGGMGTPNGGELPNGWRYRFSVTKSLSVNGENFENGVPPQIVQFTNPDDQVEDAIVERAVSYIISGN